MLTIYSKSNCSYCTQAKDYLKQRNIAYREVKVDEDAAAMQFIKGAGHRTVPQIYNGDELFVANGFIGLLNVTPEQFEALQQEKELQHVG